MQIVEEKGLIKIGGALDIGEVGVLRDALIRLGAEQRPLVLDLSAVESCDTAAVQLLYSLFQAGAQSNQTVSIVAFSTAVIDTASSVGLAIQHPAFGLKRTDEALHA